MTSGPSFVGGTGVRAKSSYHQRPPTLTLSYHLGFSRASSFRICIHAHIEEGIGRGVFIVIQGMFQLREINQMKWEMCQYFCCFFNALLFPLFLLFLLF
jgi:hypothetical protein